MHKKRKNQKKSKLPLSQLLFPACQNPPKPEFIQKYPSDAPLIDTVGSEFLADVDTSTGFDFGPLDHSPTLTDFPRGSIDSYTVDRFFIPNADVASGSLIEEVLCSGSRETSTRIYGTPLVVQSSDPIGDFKQSMEEMLVQYHAAWGEPLDWELLEELLYAYLVMNERAVYRYVYAAFFDLTMSCVTSRQRRVMES